MDFRSWGLPGPFAQQVVEVDEFSRLPDQPASLLPYGNGRSYGDACINQSGTLLHTRGLAHFIEFDESTGELECGAGVLFADIIDVFMARGWFLPVTPGTRFVTVGGAIANDVHGKNHHRAGSFGDHVMSLRLLRSDSGLIECSRSQNAALFAATIGGLGLTGLIVAARFRLRRIESGWMNVTSTRFRSIAEFLELDDKAEQSSEYSVSWIDCLSARGDALKGVCLSADHAAPGGTPSYPAAPKMKDVPLTPPFSLIAGWSLRIFNQAYFAASQDSTGAQQSVFPYFYPLDAIGHWNRIYGARGFFQFQCVVPRDSAAVSRLLDIIARSGQGSFLAVLKGFGARPAPGMLSFCRPGITLALDFANRGPKTLELLAALDRQVLDAGGAVYPAKDATMSPELFRNGYPRLAEFKNYIDPRFSSSLWRRLKEA